MILVAVVAVVVVVVAVVVVVVVLLLLLLLLGNGLLGGPWAKCMFVQKICSARRLKSCHLIYGLNTWSATCHKNLVNYMNLAEQRALGIEPGTSCIRGPILTN